MEESLRIAGKLAVGAALNSARRPVHRLYLSDSLSPLRRRPFVADAERRSIAAEAVDAARLREIAGIEHHGGIALEAGPRILDSLSDLRSELRRSERPALLFALEGFHDAHNLGYALRCLEALGVDGVLVTPRRWGAEESVLARASSGAFDRLLVCALTDPADQFRALEADGVETLVATAGAARSIYDLDLRGPVMIAVGGEFRGLSDGLRKACRRSARLPMVDTIASFPAGHAAAILAAEAARQRRRPERTGRMQAPINRRGSGGP